MHTWRQCQPLRTAHLPDAVPMPVHVPVPICAPFALLTLLAQFGLLALLSPMPAHGAESLRPLSTVIDDTVNIGLRDNLQLRRSRLQVEAAAAELDAARARYLPELGISARNSRNTGGREFEFATPAGNVSIPLLRPQEQQSELTLQQPLYVPALPAAVRAQRAALDAQQYARQALALRLRRDITTAYLRWLQAEGTIGIVRSTQALLAENLRVNEALFTNGKITEDQVLRARAEQLAVEQQLRQARNGATQLQSYLNFLLNRTLDTPLEPAEAGSELRRAHVELAALRTAAGMRPELSASRSGIAAADARAAVARAARLPSVALAASGGSQGEKYEFGKGRNFSTISLLLNWNLFDGGRRPAGAGAPPPAPPAWLRSSCACRTRSCSGRLNSRFSSRWTMYWRLRIGSPLHWRDK